MSRRTSRDGCQGSAVEEGTNQYDGNDRRLMLTLTKALLPQLARVPGPIAASLFSDVA
jgi:hypothetical protein